MPGYTAAILCGTLPNVKSDHEEVCRDRQHSVYSRLHTSSPNISGVYVSQMGILDEVMWTYG